MQDAQLEIVTIGDELLLGETVDGNSAWLGQRLGAAGLRVTRRTSVGDNEAAIQDAVRSALERVAIVLCTGGLGPTHDDLTRSAIAGLFRRDLRIDPAVLDALRERFRARGLEMAAINQVQAQVPAGGIVFPNARGTAPGLAIENEGRAVIMLPGVPFEMRGLVEDHVLPWLLKRFPERPRGVCHRVVRTTGIAESRLAEKLADVIPALHPLSVAFLPDISGVDLRITCWPDAALQGRTGDDALSAAEAAIRAEVDEFVYGTDGDDLAQALGNTLAARSLTVALAESCTGGLVAKRLTDVPGASSYVAGGIVAYSNDVKRKQLHVGVATLESFGAVSEEVAREMAAGARHVFGADTAIAVTGIAGPGGGSPEKPVGTVWIAAMTAQQADARRFHFGGDRREIRERSAQAALALLWNLVRASPVGSGR